MIADAKKIRVLARMGYAARGSVYLVIGGLALMAASGEGGKSTDSKGAIVEILHQPFGNVLLVLLILGLVGYVIWRLVQSIKDTDSHGTSAVVRAGLMASAISHGLLALWALKLLLGEKDQHQNTQLFLATDMGQLVIGLAGIAFIGAGFAHIYKGWTARFERYMDIPADHDIWARPLCRFGLISRGLVWCIIGWFCVQSALFARKNKIEGMAEALELLRSNSYGVWLFGTVAAGLFAFGLYSILEALYRKIELTSGSQFSARHIAEVGRTDNYGNVSTSMDINMDTNEKRTNKYGD